jgi:hypothetical protein|tara:strand:- start:2504 stop:2884 length:381 start_codon:yes stop_codon:yes gene_type:complete
MVDIVPERRKQQAGWNHGQGIGNALLDFAHLLSQMRQEDKSKDQSPDQASNSNPAGTENAIAAIAAAQNKSVEGERKKRMDAPFRARAAHEEGLSSLVPRFRSEEYRWGQPFGPHHLERRNWNSYR